MKHSPLANKPNQKMVMHSTILAKFTILIPYTDPIRWTNIIQEIKHQ